MGITPAVETAPCEGRNPKILQYDAGTRTLPPVSVPAAKKIFYSDGIMINQAIWKNNLEWNIT